jgi:hypothetical protein
MIEARTVARWKCYDQCASKHMNATNAERTRRHATCAAQRGNHRGPPAPTNTTQHPHLQPSAVPAAVVGSEQKRNSQLHERVNHVNAHERESNTFMQPGGYLQAVCPLW